MKSRPPGGATASLNAMPERDDFILRGRAAAPRWRILAQLLVCVAPAMAVVARGNPALGARWLFLSMLALLAWHALMRNPVSYLALFTGAVPAAMMLRDYFYFNSVTAILIGGVLLWLAVRGGAQGGIRGNRTLLFFLAAAFLYWWISWLRTGSYSTNFRVLELAMSATGVYLLGGYRSYLATALVGIGMSTAAVGLALAPYGDRLGMADFGESSMGNPVTLGLPAALVLLLAIAQGGRWLLASNRPMLRAALLMAAGACLLLSTSRGSWVVALAGFLAVFAAARGRRLAMLAWLLPLAAAGLVVMSTSRGEAIGQYFLRAFAPGRTLSQRTTGRYDQWVAMPRIVADSPVWGHGPGSGVRTNARFTGSMKAWHSLYLQLLVETGAIGFVLLLLLFGGLLAGGMRHLRLTGDPVPLAGTLCFMTIAISVSGMDAISGVFLGLGFLSRQLAGIWMMREVVLTRTVEAVR